MYAVFELYIKDDEPHDDMVDVAVADTDTHKIVRYNYDDFLRFYCETCGLQIDNLSGDTISANPIFKGIYGFIQDILGETDVGYIPCFSNALVGDFGLFKVYDGIFHYDNTYYRAKNYLRIQLGYHDDMIYVLKKYYYPLTQADIVTEGDFILARRKSLLGGS